MLKTNCGISSYAERTGPKGSATYAQQPLSDNQRISQMILRSAVPHNAQKYSDLSNS